MPRQKNTRPTNIYWLYDSRPEMVALHGPHGHPFYCGKTVTSPNHRLAVHRCEARRNPNNPHSARIAQGGEYLTMRIIEVVPVEDDWCARERFWIATIRLLFPGGTNVTVGGQGSPGYIPTAETREKHRAFHTGRKASPETCARLSAALKGRVRTPEHCAKISAGKLGKKHTAEANAKKSLATRGLKKSPEHSAKIAASLRGVKHTPERCAKISANRKGLGCGPRSPEYCAKVRANKKVYWATDRAAETRAKMSAARTAYWAARRAERASA